jgi:hypothetical protein
MPAPDAAVCARGEAGATGEASAKGEGSTKRACFADIEAGGGGGGKDPKPVKRCATSTSLLGASKGLDSLLERSSPAALRRQSTTAIKAMERKAAQIAESFSLESYGTSLTDSILRRRALLPETKRAGPFISLEWHRDAHLKFDQLKRVVQARPQGDPTVMRPP